MKSLQLFIISFLFLTITKPDSDPLDTINLNINIPYEKPDGIEGSKRKEMSDNRDMVFDDGDNGNNNGYIKGRFKDIGYENAKYTKYGRYGRYGRYGGKVFDDGDNGNNNGYIKGRFKDIGYENSKYTKYGRYGRYGRYGGKDKCKCGIKNMNQTIVGRTGGREVLGGNETKVNEYPWIVLLLYTDTLVFCGGSVIADNWILTAAHCVGVVDNDTVGGDIYDPKNITIVIGEHDKSTPAETSLTKNVSIDKIIVHPEYDQETVFKDIALLRLSSPVDLKVYTPVCLPSTGEDFTAKKAWVYGWGITQDKGYFSNVLLDLEIAVVSDASAKQAYASKINPGGPVNLPAKQLAVLVFAGGERGKNTCTGDSGGLLSYDKNGKHTQIGISSWGSSECAMAGLPSAFTDVSALRPWIDLQISKNGGATFCQ